MSLFICEKPSQARDIAAVMGIQSKGEGYIQAGGHEVTWCIGHLLEMDDPESYDDAWKKWRIEDLPMVPNPWSLHVRKTVSKQYQVVASLVQKAAVIVVATDADREGESIAREMIERLHFTGNVQRLWLSALDRASISKALSAIQCGSTTEPLYYAAQARQRADWLVGMNMTRAYTLLGRRTGLDAVLSVGRVQTPTLALIVDRDRTIENFVSVPYFVNWIEVEAKGRSFRSILVTRGNPVRTGFDPEGRCIDEAVARTLAEKSQGTATVRRADYDQKTSRAPLPFSLSALQQACSKHWGYGAKEVLDIAQALYETHKLTTYPRSDCRYLPQDQFEESGPILDSIRNNGLFDARILDQMDPSRKSRAWNDRRVTAHHAIIPTATGLSEATLKEREVKVYRLICQHFVAQFLPDYRYLQSTVLLSTAQLDYRATGRSPIAPGWKQIFAHPQGRADEPLQKLPKVQVGDSLTILESGVDSKQTTPPKPFEEGTLIAAMSNIQQFVRDPELKKILKETEGIGTEATRASIIETLYQRKFIEKRKKQVVSTPLGRDLVDLLPTELKDPGTTALMERMLGQIAQGNGTLEDYLHRQTVWLTALTDKVKRQYGELPGVPRSAADSRSLGDCPQCGKPLWERRSRYGKFIGCSGFPDCKYIARKKKRKRK